MQGPESKSVISPDHEREEMAHGEADLGGRPDLARSYCLTLGLGSHIYLFIYKSQLCLKHCWR